MWFFRSDPREGAGNVTRPADLNTEIVLSGTQTNTLKHIFCNPIKNQKEMKIIDFSGTIVLLMLLVLLIW